MLFTTSSRNIRFLVAAKCMRTPTHAPFFKWAKSIPVERAGDLAKQGSGQILFVDKINIVGEGTRFLEEFNPGD